MPPPPAAAAVVIPRKFTARYLRRFGFAARTVFDVGMCQGTAELYRLFADRRLVLIDPLPQAQENVHRRWPGLAFDFVPAALGAAPGTALLNVTASAEKSAIAERTPLTAEPVLERRPVPVTTLDDIVAARDLPPPFGLKLDTEGAELDILRGAERTLPQTEFIIAEVSVKKRFVGGYRFSEVVAFLGTSGFELIDILNFTAGTARFYDCLFLRHDHPAFDGPLRRSGPDREVAPT